MYIEDDKKVGGIGASEIGKLFTKEGLKAKTAKTLMLDKAIEVMTGYRKDITTAAMQHGLFNEEEAFYQIVKPTFENSVLRSDVSVYIQQGLWATPDVTDDTLDITLDIKCPYTVASYWNNINRLPQNYIVQNQMQMAATGHKKGYICLYLTSNRIDEYGNKIEYDIPLEDRHCFMPLEYDETYRDEIIKRYEGFVPLRDQLVNTLSKVKPVNDKDFFYLNRDRKVTRLRDKSNFFTWESSQMVKNGQYFYVIENKAA